jgi:hypothetical protein
MRGDLKVKTMKPRILTRGATVMNNRGHEEKKD